MDAKLERINELKAQKLEIEAELTQLQAEVQTELAKFIEPKPRKTWTKKVA